MYQDLVLVLEGTYLGSAVVVALLLVLGALEVLLSQDLARL